MEYEKLKKKLKTVLSNRKEIVFAYLFGSIARGVDGPLSDVDVAVYLEEEKKPESGPFGYRAELIALLQGELNTNDIDLVVLNEAPLFLAFNVLKDGELIFCRSKETRVEYHYRIQREYLDFKPALKVQNFYLDKNINRWKKERLKDGKGGADKKAD